jgi:hypothetical protein
MICHHRSRPPSIHGLVFSTTPALWRVAMLCIILVACFNVSVASTFSNLYDEDTLKHWQSSFQEDVVWNFEHGILPHLTPEEKRQLRNVKIEFPLRGKRADVFEFYTQEGRVFMPVLAMRFFGDIALAYAWLDENGYNVSTVLQYVGMIHYRPADEFPGKQYPRPLDALQIPANARDSSRVLDAMGKCFTTAMTFVLCHELGHIYHKHPGYGVASTQARANEAEADQFAVEIMRRLGTLPVGASFWFLTAASVEGHRVDFGSDKEWESYLRERTHPLTADRMESLATAMEKAAPDFARTQNDPVQGLVLARSIANEITKVAQNLKDERIHMAYRAQSAGTKVEMLAPRRSVAFSVDGVPDERFPDVPFNGVYDCEIRTAGINVPLNLRIVLRRKGDKVIGAYSYSGVTGTVKGNVTRTTLEFEWIEADARGSGSFESAKDGKSFIGGWGSGASKDSGGTWSAKRVDP